jgi:transposase
MMAPPAWEAGVDRYPSNLPIDEHIVRRVEVLAGPERRRRWSWEEKAQIVAESLAPDAVASAIARRHGLHPNQLYAWRKALSAAADEAAETAAARAGMAPLDFVPVVITDQASARAGAIEIEVAGARVRVSSGVDPALLADVLRTLKALG